MSKTKRYFFTVLLQHEIIYNARTKCICDAIFDCNKITPCLFIHFEWTVKYRVFWAVVVFVVVGGFYNGSKVLPLLFGSSAAAAVVGVW